MLDVLRPTGRNKIDRRGRRLFRTLRHFPSSPRAGRRDASLAARVLAVNHGPSQTQADKNRRYLEASAPQQATHSAKKRGKTTRALRTDLRRTSCSNVPLNCCW